MFGSCQQGLSATFDKDFHYVIFGAPGAYNWKGSLVCVCVFNYEHRCIVTVAMEKKKNFTAHVLHHEFTLHDL